ncbi:MAG: hypothetical protein OEY47_01320 [Candidatus Bathyarchaeota archaeon]|nr:hypothetical protein [Candidatus Bathyarchaeota archaeon]
MAKIRMIIMMSNGDLVFTKKKYETNKIKVNWGEITFKAEHICSRIPKFLGIPLFLLKKVYLIVREGDKEPLSLADLPKLTQKDVEELAKSKLIKTLGFETPRETSILTLITFVLLIAVFVVQILILNGVRI